MTDRPRINPSRRRAIKSNAHLLDDPGFEMPATVTVLSRPQTESFQDRPFPTHTLIAALLEVLTIEQYRSLSRNLRALADVSTDKRFEDAAMWAAVLWRAQV